MGSIRSVRLALLTLCLASSAFADQVLVDRVLAVVDGTPLTRSAVEERAQSIELLSRGARSRELARRDALHELIDELLIGRDCQRMRLSVENAEIDAALQTVAEQNQLSLDQLADEVRKQGLSLPAYRVMLRKRILEMRWVTAKMDRAGLANAANVSEYTLKERSRLVAELRLAAAIEVLP